MSTPTSNSPGRSKDPFFNRPSTEETITDIAHTEALVVYVGAGATVTESGHNWRSMVELLFAELTEEGDILNAIADSFDLPKRATIVKEYFGRTYRGASTASIANVLRKALYQDAQWKNGDYVNAIALLCIEKLSLGHHILIVTTNYDQYLEHALRRMAGEPGDTELVRSITLPATDHMDSANISEDLAKVDNQVPVVHLHGVILKVAKPGQSEEIVLDEVDYLRTETESSALLTQLFKSNDVLILGSSLEDAPLMRALWHTKNTRTRWAVFPRHNYKDSVGAYNDHPQTYADLIFALQCRCQAFDVEIIAPDFFSQAAQFVREIAVAATRGAATPADYPEVSYSRRLDRWWDSWFESRSKATPAAQRRDHRLLSQRVPKIQKELASNSDEKLKLELWVRWQPLSDNRSLQLWASSTGTWIDHTTMRNTDVNVHSEYLAVQAFCQGVALTREKNGADHERWKRHLAVPIRVGREPFRIPVGVIILATTETGPHSIIDKTNKMRMNTLSNLVEAIGTELLDHGDFSVGVLAR